MATIQAQSVIFNQNGIGNDIIFGKSGQSTILKQIGNYYYYTNFPTATATTNSSDNILQYESIVTSGGTASGSFLNGSYLLRASGSLGFGTSNIFVNFINNSFDISNFIQYDISESHTLDKNYTIGKVGMFTNTAGLWFDSNYSNGNILAVVKNSATSFSASVNTGITNPKDTVKTLFSIKQNNSQTASFYINGINVANIPFYNNLNGISCNKISELILTTADSSNLSSTQQVYTLNISASLGGGFIQ